ncbi:MAG: hypothetical protein AB1705_20390, partial [Verrucomicrobiota bacterium]
MNAATQTRWPRVAQARIDIRGRGVEDAVMLPPRMLPVLAALLACPTFSGAQFYAPETEYHDFAQRTFVVELARVLAWRENRQQVRIHEITYKVSTGSNRQTEWQIQWLDAKGKPLRRAQVSYPEAGLLSGPAFYRTVFKQLWNDQWSPLPPAAESE